MPLESPVERSKPTGGLRREGGSPPGSEMVLLPLGFVTPPEGSSKPKRTGEG